jgi:hypothetical protein
MPNYQQCFQQPQWNTSTGAMLCDATVNVTLVGITNPLPAGANQIGDVGQRIPAGATPFNARATSGANAAVTATQAAAANKKNYLLGYQVVLRGANAAADAGISLQDGTSEKLYDAIGLGAARGTKCALASDLPPVAGSNNTTMNLVVGAAGANAITEVSMWGYTV